MKTTIKALLMICLLGGLLPSCKPTEKGYRQAYEAAKSKREQKDPDEDLLTGGHKLLSEEASNWRVIAGDSLQLEHKFLKPVAGSAWPQSGPYRLAVAQLKMTTNANSMLSDLKKEGSLTPVIATDGKDTYYIIAGSATYVDSLTNVLSTFKQENPEFRYVGLTPEKPVIIVGR
ncbi:MAG: hypothetical protein K2J58_05525 [Muribaculaceae bacterium]|nr:hypothetical protein [Muribaculaceae bacterium]